VEVSTSALTELPPDLHLLKDIAFEIPHSANRVILRGFRMDSADLRTTDPLHLTLYWQTYTDKPIRQNYEVRLRLISPQGHVWHQTRGRSPVNGLYPTTAWQPREIVPDFHQLDLPTIMPPGVYLLQVGLFPPFSQKGLTLPDVDEDYLPLAQVSVSPNAAWSPAIQHHSRMNFDSLIMLLGYDFPETVQPGGEAVLTLYWRRIGQVSIDYDLVLKLHGAGGDVLWQSVEPPFFGEHSTSRWAESELIADAHDVPIPTAATGLLELTIGLRDPNSQRPLPVAGGWQAGQRDQSVLARIQTQDPPSSSEDENLPANFENRVSLLDYELHNVQVRRGDALELTLAWQGLAAMNEDYTIFVHLLDENEQIWGQQDTQPVYGTYPTSQWSAGEIIFDRHRLWTHERSPLGLYRVEIGLYLLRSMERLQVLDLSGNAISDRVLIEWVEIVP
jgi:hypothetical protein